MTAWQCFPQSRARTLPSIVQRIGDSTSRGIRCRQRQTWRGRQSPPCFRRPGTCQLSGPKSSRRRRAPDTFLWLDAASVSRFSFVQGRLPRWWSLLQFGMSKNNVWTSKKYEKNSINFTIGLWLWTNQDWVSIDIDRYWFFKLILAILVTSRCWYQLFLNCWYFCRYPTLPISTMVSTFQQYSPNINKYNYWQQNNCWTNLNQTSYLPRGFSNISNLGITLIGSRYSFY